MNLAPWPWGAVEARSGTVAPPSGASLVYVNAGVQRVPPAWLDAAMLVVPIVGSDGIGAVFHVCVRAGRPRCAVERVTPARFVPCVGTHEAPLGVALTDAFRANDHAGAAALAFGEP